VADAVRNGAAPSRNDAANGLAGRCPAWPVLIRKTELGRTKLNVVMWATRLALLSLFAAGTAAAANLHGGFADMNPAVSCEHAH